MNRRFFMFVLAFLLYTVVDGQAKISMNDLRREIMDTLSHHRGNFALAFKNLSNDDELFINEHELFHAASTMKTPVLIELFKQAYAGRFYLTDPILIKNEFRSIADSSMFSLNPADDGDTDLYKHIGQELPVSYLAYRMITLSSNLATNLLIELVDARNVTATMRELGAKDIQVLRGVEDNKAYDKGMNNMVTAYDLMLIYEKMARGEIINSTVCADMIKILLNQHFNEVIPAGLPPNVKVAHKTGSFTSVHHDSGIVFLPDGRKYVLVILSKNLDNDEAAVKAMASVSAMIYHYVTQ